MFNTVKSILQAEGITRVGTIPITECEIINERILPKEAKSAIIFVIPYRSEKTPSTDGFSEYARIYDYHKFSAELYERTISRMQEETNRFFQGFCDHSPINEKLAAAKCGLGVIGKNSLFFDYRYGSFVFLGSLLTDIDVRNEIYEIKHCENCGLCALACPNNAILDFGIDRYKCLSAISQKKQKAPFEVKLLEKYNIVWGCDICQNVCPINQTAEISPIPYFKNTRIPHIDKDFILNLTDEEFIKFAFSYKGRKIVLNNIEFIT